MILKSKSQAARDRLEYIVVLGQAQVEAAEK